MTEHLSVLPQVKTDPLSKAEPQASTGTLEEALAYFSEDSRRIVSDRINLQIAQQLYRQADDQLLVG